MEEQYNQKQIFNLLSRISIQMTSILDIDELITFFVGSMAKILNAGRTSLMLLDQTKKELFIKASHGFDTSDDGPKLKLGEMFAGWVAQKGSPLLVQDVEKEFPNLIKDKSSKYQSKSFIIVPVKLKENMLGILSVTERKDNKVFTNDDLNIINLLCHWLSVHIENIKSFENNFGLVTTDSLTKLFNHRYFQERLADEVYRAERYQRPLSLLLLDIDDFSWYNQTYGYSAGDNVLKQIGRIIKENIRRVDSAARFGPEEIMIILPETELEQAIFTGEKIREAIGYSIIFNNTTSSSEKTRLTVSVGVAQYKKGLTKEKLIQCVCDALQDAKQSGKNRVRTSK